MKLPSAIACLAALALTGAVYSASASNQEAASISVATIALEGPPEDQSLESTLALLEKAAAGGTILDLVVTPMMPFLSFEEAAAERDLEAFANFARRTSVWLAIALTEKLDSGAESWTAVLFDRSGRFAGKYRKSHRIEGDPEIQLGDELPVFETDFGRIGLTIGTDFYFPEIYTVLGLRGADVTTWQHCPEPTQDHTTWRSLLMARALDNKTPLVTAHYSDRRQYLAANTSVSRRGSLWGRSQIINRVGVPIADTGFDAGVASARLYLQPTKGSAGKSAESLDESIFFVPNKGGRVPFASLAEEIKAEPKPTYSKRKVRIAMVHSNRDGNWRDEKIPEVLLSQLDEAAKLDPDVVLFSEMQANIVTDAARQTLREISSRADSMDAYVIMAGVDPSGDDGSVAWVWNREGEVVQQKPIYWPRGHTHMEPLDTDFGRIGIHVCGDLYLPELDRILALKGAEIIFDPSLMWAPDGETNLALAKARAADNGVWLAVSHWNFNLPSLRSWIVDPYGQTLFGSPYQESGVMVYEIDLDNKRRWIETRDEPNNARSPYASDWGIPVEREGWREMVFGNRRPELYDGIGGEAVASKKK